MAMDTVMGTAMGMGIMKNRFNRQYMHHKKVVHYRSLKTHQ